MDDQEKTPAEDSDRGTGELWEPENSDLEHLIVELEALQDAMRADWASVEPGLSLSNNLNLKSAENLVHYLSLRKHDIRRLQRRLARQGISSLGRVESHVIWNLAKVSRLLSRIVGREYEPRGEDEAVSFDIGYGILKERSEALLGIPKHGRKVGIMVTLPTDAAFDLQLVQDLIRNGMDCARINCAHDNAEIWSKMVENVRRSCDETESSCRICFDIAGPKLRTGQFKPGPRVLKLRPRRDLFGRVTSPAQVKLALIPSGSPSMDVIPILQVSNSFFRRLHNGAVIKFEDARGSRRKIKIISIHGGEAIGELRKTAYLVPETDLRIKTSSGTASINLSEQSIPASEQFATLSKGDTLILCRSQEPGRPEQLDQNGHVIEPARVPCTLHEVFGWAKPGESIWLDDGKIGGKIGSVTPEEMTVRITSTSPKGDRLRADKGINLPETELRLPPLTDKDLSDLKFAAAHTDLIGYSFVRTGQDVKTLQNELSRLGRSEIGIILKIETRSAFENLPEILLASLEAPAVGVMLARGDLAVEIGFERLAEVQEEVLWMCEAAHLPVIWATQVLEQLSKRGVYSRAEITDAAMSERAECVMLNKGPFIVHAVRTLDDVLTRMEPHQEKKRSMMRPLQIAQRFFENLNKSERATTSNTSSWFF